MFCMRDYASHLCLVPKSTEEGIGSPGTRVKDGCEQSCDYWELYPGPLEETPVLLTSGLSLQSLRQQILISSFLTECNANVHELDTYIIINAKHQCFQWFM